VQDLNTLSTDLTSMLLPWIGVLISLMIALWVKNFVDAAVKGLTFKMNKAFNEGDKVMLDGTDAIIVKIGTMETVFGTYGVNGFTWRYVPNSRIPFLKLEKIINKDLHLDTDQEKAKKIQSLIDKGQTNGIEKNTQAIEEIRNGK
jgi:hypothetical protein